MQITKSKWFQPLFAVALGVLVFVAQWIGGDPRSGLISFAILAGAGLVLLLGGRSETIRGLRGDGRDERFQRIDIHATALAGLAVILAVIIAFVVELAKGKSGSPYGWLGAIGGVTYLAAVIVFRIRGSIGGGSFVFLFGVAPLALAPTVISRSPKEGRNVLSAGSNSREGCPRARGCVGWPRLRVGAGKPRIRRARRRDKRRPGGSSCRHERGRGLHA